MGRLLRRLLSAGVLVLLLAGTARAGDGGDSILRLPAHGVSTKVGRKWKIRQGISPFLTLSRSSTRIHVHACDYTASEAKEAVTKAVEAFRKKVGMVDDVAVQPWEALCVKNGWLAYIPPDDARDGRLFAAVARSPGPSIWLASSLGRDDAELFDEVVEIVNCLDVSAHVHRRRHVDWGQNWTLDFEPGWCGADALLDRRTWVSPDGTCTLAAVNLEELASRLRVIPPDSNAYAVWARLVFRELEPVLLKQGLRPDGVPTIEEQTQQEFVKTALLESRLVSSGSGDPKRVGMVSIRTAFETKVPGGVAIVLVAKDRELEGAKQGLSAFQSWRIGTYPGPLCRDVQPTRVLTEKRERFATPRKPTVTFMRPRRWRFAPADGDHRIAEISGPCSNARTFGEVHWYPAPESRDWPRLLEEWRERAPEDSRSESKLTVVGGPVTRIYDARCEQTLQKGWAAAEPSQRFVGVQVELPSGSLVVTMWGPADVIDLQLPALHAWLASIRIAPE